MAILRLGAWLLLANLITLWLFRYCLSEVRKSYCGGKILKLDPVAAAAPKIIGSRYY
jgi:hypothetical protein